jgi:uncharacterized protein (TIGR02266 family)
MADDKGPRAASIASAPVRRTTGAFVVETGSGPVPRDARVAVSVPMRIRYESILDFHDTQSVNLSRSGVFISCPDPRPVGTIIDFEFALTDGLTLLKGKGEVVRVTSTPASGMGVRFRDLDEEARHFIDRVVQVNEQEGRRSSVPLDFSSSQAGAAASNPLRGATGIQAGLTVDGRDMRIKLTPLTVGYFLNNPLLNIRLGGFVVPCDENVSLGALFDVSIESLDGQSLFVGKGKVVAKQEHRLGIRLAEADKTVLARLQTEIGRLGPMGTR